MSHKRNFTAIVTSVLCSIVISAHANVNVTNHTDYFGTAKTNLSPCSSISPKGILHPHSTMNIEQSLIKSFCGVFDCNVEVFLNKSCQGKRVAIVKMNAKTGIKSIQNYGRDKVSITGGHLNLTVNPA